MNKTIKRSLAVASVAALGVIGAAGSASAASFVYQTSFPSGSNVGVFCSTGTPWLKVELDRQGDGFGAEEFTTDNVRVKASDNGGRGNYLNYKAEVSSINVQWLDEQEDVISSGTSKVNASKSGSATFARDIDGVDQLKVTVNYKKLHTYSGKVVCRVAL